MAAARALEKREGFIAEYLPVDSEGFIDLDALAERLDETTLVVSIMAVNNEVGTIQDIPRIAEIVGNSGAFFHCDAAQAPCALNISELAAHADLISLSGHKIYGPQGIGALYILRDVQESIEPIIYGGGTAECNLRSGTVPVPLCVGMAAAAEILQTDEGAGRAQTRGRSEGSRSCRASYSKVAMQVSINGPTGDRRSPRQCQLEI